MAQLGWTLPRRPRQRRGDVMNMILIVGFLAILSLGVVSMWSDDDDDD